MADHHRLVWAGPYRQLQESVIFIADDRARRTERRLVLIRSPEQVRSLAELTRTGDRPEITALTATGWIGPRPHEQ